MALSYVTSSSGSGGAGTSFTVTVPGGMSANDLAIIVARVYYPADGVTISAPAGWSAIGGAAYHQTSTDQTADRWQIGAWYKFISGDSGTWSSWSWTGSAYWNWKLDVIRGAPTTGGPIDLATTQATTYVGPTQPPATQNWGDGSTGRPVISLGQTNEIVILVLTNDMGFTYNALGGWNVRGNESGQYCWDKAFASSGSIGTIQTVTNNPADETATFIAIRAVAAPTCTANPVISDTTSAGRWREGDSLSTTDGTWTGSPTLTYQWKRDGSPISSATSNTYTLVSADVGCQITMTVTGTNAGGSASATSDPSGTVSALTSGPTLVTAPSITGAPVVFQTLNCNTGQWTNSPTGYAYLWRKNAGSIAGGTTSAYTTVFADLAGTIDCVVTASNAGGSAVGTAAALGPIVGSINTPVVTQVLRSTQGVWTNSPTSFAYQWLQDGTSMGTAAASGTYAIRSSDVGHNLSVRVVASNASGASAPATSAQTGSVVSAPVNTVVPAIIGTAQQGQTLSTDNGTWSYSPTSYTYQWKRDGSPLGGATNTSYTLVAGDVGHTITVTVTAANIVGSASATSAATASVVASGTATFAISLNSTTKVITWSAYTGAVSYQTATSNGARTDASRTTTYGNVGTALSWTPGPVSGQTMYYGVAAALAGTSVVWCDSEVSVAWPAATMAIGCNSGDWGGNTSFGPSGGLTEAQDFAQGGIDWIRVPIDEFPDPADLKNYYLTEALQAIVCHSGPYNSGGVAALVGTDNGQSWATAALQRYQANAVPIAKAPVFEILNEPYGSWFFGSSATSQANAEAFGQLIKTTYTTFHNALGSNCPKIVAATFGNGAGVGQPIGTNPSWWTWLHNKHSDIASYYDGVVMHPYGGTGDRTVSGQGDRNGVTSANLATGKPVYITEVGWPTAGQGGNYTATGDSLQWTDAEQATNIGNFLNWAKGTGYVSCVMIYHHYDTSSPAYYGIIYLSGNPSGTAFRHKPAFAVVGAA